MIKFAEGGRGGNRGGMGGGERRGEEGEVEGGGLGRGGGERRGLWGGGKLQIILLYVAEHWAVILTRSLFPP